uniref:Uncharacterized protein n=1 Tax=Molossus molossus TaxID=27622 RepID=A0A7J8F962_MOLMO|nr:hypothetical protein HJG59_008577 [Molossus molossus]
MTSAVNWLATFLCLFVFILIRGHFSIFCSDRAGGRERKKEREKHRCEGTHRVVATLMTNQGQGQTATKVRALSGNQTRVCLYRRPTLQPLSQTGQGHSSDLGVAAQLGEPSPGSGDQVYVCSRNRDEKES